MQLTHELLASFSPFNTLTFEYLAKVMDKASLQDYAKGAIIFKRGRELDEAVYLVSGNVDLIDSQFAVSPVNSSAELHRVPLNNTSPTQVSAVAKSAVTVLKVERDFLDLVMVWSETGHEAQDKKTTEDNPAPAQFSPSSPPQPHLEEGDWMSSLLQSPFFNRIPPGNIRQLFVRFTPRKVVADELVIREGERGEHFYVLESGSATVLDKQGNILAALRPGDYFGEESLVGDTTRNATVKMLTPGKLMCLGKDDFITLLQEPVRNYVSYQDLQSSHMSSRVQIIDVRLPLERRFQSVPGSRNIPLSQLRKTLPELDHSKIYVVTDDAGRRCDVAAQLLTQAGFEAVILKEASLLQAAS
jgi:CRP-like cAMP-binding protein